MARALIWLAFTYGVLKVASLLRARGPGYRRSAIGWRDRLLAREPGLFFVALLVSVPLALLAGWYAQRAFAGQYAHATDCYGRIMALRDVPAFRDTFDSYVVYERVEGHRDMAAVLARDLERTQADVSRDLSDRAGAFAAHYRAVAGRGDQRAVRAEIEAAGRCLLPPGAAGTPAP